MSPDFFVIHLPGWSKYSPDQAIVWKLFLLGQEPKREEVGLDRCWVSRDDIFFSVGAAELSSKCRLSSLFSISPNTAVVEVLCHLSLLRNCGIMLGNVVIA
jgi:hypothetical protein